MTKFLLFILALLLSSGCVNSHGVSAKYYSECKEYYDLQGYYHNECGEDDIITYKEMKEQGQKVIDSISSKKEKPKGNIW